MSTPTDASSAAIIDLYSGIFIGNCCAIGAAVFFIYEWIITSSRSVDMFWTRKLTGASVLFLANRYIVLVTNVMPFIGYMRMSDKSCTLFVQSYLVFTWIQYVPWAAFSALRVLALCRSWAISCLVLLLSLAPFGLNFIQFHFGLTGSNDPRFGCTSSVNAPPDMAKKLTIISRTCLLASDVIVIAVTWYTMPRRRGYNIGAGKDTSTLSGILLRDGTIYFISLLILNSLHLALTMISVDPSFQQASYMTLFTEPVTAVIVSRFLLDLQSTSRKALQLGHANTTRGISSGSSRPVDSVVFARVVGSIGSSTLPEGLNAPDPDVDNED